MKIVCALSAEEVLPSDDFDVLVLPEGIRRPQLDKANSRFPKAIIVGAAHQGQRMRAYLLVNSQNMIDYLKIGTDSSGSYIGTGKRPKLNIYENDRVAIGVLVCMDVEHEYRLELKDRLLSSRAAIKLLCVPADMQGHWFASEPVLGWSGVNVAVSNNNVTYPDCRAKSCVVGPDGRWLVRQSTCEPVCVTLA